MQVDDYGYSIDEWGTIVSPGKFEGEQYYAPYFYDLYLNGSYDDMENEVCIFNLDEQDWIRYPELKDSKFIRLYEDNFGFVYVQRDDRVTQYGYSGNKSSIDRAIA